jgi:hypothetical protein
MEMIKTRETTLKHEYFADKIKLFSDKTNRKKEVRRKKILGSILLASAIIACSSFLSFSNSADQNQKIADFSMIQGVVLDEPFIETKLVNNGFSFSPKKVKTFEYKGNNVVMNASVPVDINGDNRKDIDLQLVVNTKCNKLSSEQMFALANIKQGSKLILEGKIIKNEFGRPIDLVSPENGKKEPVVIDYEKSTDYVDMQNVLFINNCKMKNPVNKTNQKLLDENFRRIYSR